MIKATTVIVNRANYGRLEPLLLRLEQDRQIQSRLLLTGTTIVSEYGDFEKVISGRGFRDCCKLEIEEGRRTHESMVHTSSNLSRKLATYLEKDSTDCVVLIGDRYETLGAALAASYMNVPIVHIQGGEISGTIDGKIRHSISALSDIHLVATKRAAQVVERIASKRGTVHNVGCPCGDYILNRSIVEKDEAWFTARQQVRMQDTEEFVVISYHPDTISDKSIESELKAIYRGLASFKGRLVWFYPNSDAYSTKIRDYIEMITAEDLRVEPIANLGPSEYIELLDRARVCIGNSSSFIRDGSFLGTPVVLVGSRQQGRELAENVIYIDDTSDQAIEAAISKQLLAGKYKASSLYGRGDASERMHQILRNEFL